MGRLYCRNETERETAPDWTHGAIGHPEDVEQSGAVPDNPGWTYFFHGCGCALTDPDGTVIDVDFDEAGSALKIDPFFYGNFLHSLKKPEWSDARLKRDKSLEDAWQWELTQLQALGFLNDGDRIVLTSAGRQFGERIEPIVDEINKRAAEPESRFVMSWPLVNLGDFDGARKALDNHGNEPIHTALKAAAKSQLEQRVQRLAQPGKTPHDEMRRLEALAVCGRKYAEKSIITALEHRPLNGVNSVAVSIIDSWNDPSFADLLLHTFRRLVEPASLWDLLRGKAYSLPSQFEPPRNYIVVRIAEILIRYSDRQKLSRNTIVFVKRALSEFKLRDATGSFLAYLLDERLGREMLKQCLLSTEHGPRLDAAAFLALIANKPCIQILIDVARGDPEAGGHEAACALALIDDDQSKAVAAAWKNKYDGYEEAESSEANIHGKLVKTWSMEGIRRINVRNSITWKLDDIRRDYGPLLDRLQRRG